MVVDCKTEALKVLIIKVCIVFAGSMYSQYAIELILESKEAQFQVDSNLICIACKTKSYSKFFRSTSM